MHARAKVGTRVEETAGIFADVQKAIRQLIPPEEIATLVDNVGMPVSGINMTYNNTGTIGPQDGDIQIKLREGHRPTAEYVRMLREALPRPEEHTSELQSLMRISYAVFCLKKKNRKRHTHTTIYDIT